MKQVNILMDESLLEHVQNLSNMASLLSGKNIKISDIVVKSIIEYSKYGEVIIESKITEGQNHFNVKPVNESDEEYPSDVLMKKICHEQW